MFPLIIKSLESICLILQIRPFDVNGSPACMMVNSSIHLNSPDNLKGIRHSIIEAFLLEVTHRGVL